MGEYTLLGCGWGGPAAAQYGQNGQHLFKKKKRKNKKTNEKKKNKKNKIK